MMLNGYLPIHADSLLTTPFGFSNFLCRYLCPLMAETGDFGLEGSVSMDWRTDVQQLSHEAQMGRWMMVKSPQEVLAALGENNCALVARGLHDVPEEALTREGFMAQLAMQKRFQHSTRSTEASYSFNVAKAVNTFALTAGWKTHFVGPAALIIASVNSRNIHSWGGDSESGPFNEAEVRIRPGTSYIERALVFGKNLNLPLVQDLDELALGHYIQGRFTGEYSPKNLRKGEGILLHPHTSPDALAFAEAYGFRFREFHLTEKYGRQWYEL